MEAPFSLKLHLVELIWLVSRWLPVPRRKAPHQLEELRIVQATRVLHEEAVVVALERQESRENLVATTVSSQHTRPLTTI